MLFLHAMTKTGLTRFFNWTLLVLFSWALLACDPYSKILKNPDLDYKYKMAQEFYYQGLYYKAQPLLEELLTAYRGSDKAEDVYYYYAWCDYHLKAYTLASYHFKNFSTNFPTSKRVEDVDFMYAYCMFLESPNFALDQQSTRKALEAFQLYVNKHPRSKRISECNRMMDILRAKLEKKSVESAMLFYHMEDYRAAAVMLKNTLNDYPDISEREYLSFLIVKSYYNLAQNSIESKKEERFNETLRYYASLKDDYPNSIHLKEAGEFAEKAKSELAKLAKAQASKKEIN